MASRLPHPVNGDLQTLWAIGAMGGADDEALVARYSETRNDVAFRILVERHGPMVLRVCRQTLGDGHAAEEAAQAVFLILARKAGTFRIQGTAAAWLYGVARRVAARARVRAASREARERRTTEVVAMRLGRMTTEPSKPDDWSAIHEEIGRLPEKYRTAVVLCYLEEKSYEQAAMQIGCPIGTIRVRLSRARDKLRQRLEHRGFGPDRILLASKTDATTPAGWVDKTVFAAMAYVRPSAVAAGMVPAAVVELSDEILRTLTMSTSKSLMGAVLAIAITAGGAWGFIEASGGQDDKPAAPHEATSPSAANPSPARNGKAETVKPLAEPINGLLAREAPELIKLARQRVEVQRAFYEERRITVDRILGALKLLNEEELNVAPNAKQRILAAQRYKDSLEGIVKREDAELKAGRGTVADLTEAQLAHQQAYVALLKQQTATESDELTRLRERVDSLERELKSIKGATRRP